MTGRLAKIVVLAMLLLPAGRSPAQDLIPIPEFTEHRVPPSESPQTSPRAEAPWREYLDLGALCVFLVLATLFALKLRRRWALSGLAVVSVLWLGFWRKGCICPIGAIQNVGLALGDASYAIPWTVVAVFTLPLLFTLFFGRTFCAAVCPLGGVQELVAVRPVQVPNWLENTLGMLPWIYLGLAVLFAVTGTAFVICRYDPFVGFFRLSAETNMLILGACLLVIGVFVGRPYCRYLCPYGAILGLFSRVSKWHVSITPDECIQCRLCEDACPYGAIQAPTVPQSPEERVRGRRRLALLLAALPLLVLLGVGLGQGLEVPLSRVDPTVRLADRVLLEETGKVEGTTDASDAFRNTGRPAADLYCEAQARTKMFGTAGAWFGAWVGLVIGVRLIYLSVRRRRSDYEPVRANCVACGRCFRSCPREMLRLGLIADVAEVVPQKKGSGVFCRNGPEGASHKRLPTPFSFSARRQGDRSR